MRDIYDFDPENRAQRGENVFTRVCAGFIDSIDTKNGTAIITLEDFVGSRSSVVLSCDYISSVGPGWFRFMPSKGDKVLCGFRPNNEIEILRYKTISYPQFAQFAEDANPPFVFRELKSGEFEIMSVGYAEIWGSKLGKLHLAGGLATIDLDRDSAQISHSAALHYLNSDTSEFRFGSIRRTNPFKTAPDTSQVAPGVANKEYKVTLLQNISGVYKTLYDATIGKVMDYVAAPIAGLFTPRLHSTTGQALSADINIFTVDGVQKVRIQVDEMGNTQVDLPATATDGFRLITAIGSLIFKALKIEQERIFYI